jgi:hypothetical protein
MQAFLTKECEKIVWAIKNPPGCALLRGVAGVAIKL